MCIRKKKKKDEKNSDNKYRRSSLLLDYRRLVVDACGNRHRGNNRRAQRNLTARGVARDCRRGGLRTRGIGRTAES